MALQGVGLLKNSTHAEKFENVLRLITRLAASSLHLGGSDLHDVHPWWSALMALLSCFSGTSGQTVQTEGDRSGYVGTQVELRCHFANSKPPVKISQVTWQKFLNGTKQNVAITNPVLGVSVLPQFKDRVRFKNLAVHQSTPSLEDTTVVLSDLKLSDEASYICEYTTFPAGNRESMVNLTVYGMLQ